MTPFLGLWDIHYGSDVRRGQRSQAHDAKLLEAVLKFAQDYRPELVVLGGDQLNCAPISHWLKDKRRSQEGGRWTEELKQFNREFLAPLERVLPRKAVKVWLDGNHEDWVEDLLDKHPELDDDDGSVLHHAQVLNLVDRGWKYLPQGGIYKAGHLHFIHGDTVSGGQHVAKQAVEQYDRNVRLGHHHTFQAFTRVAAADTRDRKTGIAVPCLGHLNPAFLENRPSRWTQGFLHGYINADGTFCDYVTIATGGAFTINGKTYRG